MDSRAVIAGKLHFINLADLFQIFGGNGSTGTLHLASQHSPHQGTIHFRKGDPINASYGAMEGLEAIYALFGWTGGNFEFFDEEIKVAHKVKQNRMEIVLDALRMLDDGEIQKVGPDSFEGMGSSKRYEVGLKQGLPPVIKGPMLDYMHVIKEDIFKDGTNIVKEGDHGKWMWVIFEGVAKVTKETAKGTLEIARLGEGCFIGTFKALLFGEYSRSATVTAEGDVRLCLLDADPLYNEYSSLSPRFRQLLLSLDGRLRAVTEKTVQLYLKENDDERILKNKKLLMKQGAASEDLYLIKEGKAFIVGQTKKGHFPLATLREGDVFGYIPFVDVGHEPRTSSVLASEDLQVEKLDIQALQEEYNSFSTTFRNMIYYLGTSIFMTTKLAHHFHRSE